jgi:hypothetical protein
MTGDPMDRFSFLEGQFTIQDCLEALLQLGCPLASLSWHEELKYKFTIYSKIAQALVKNAFITGV